jgi:hypothetical protein
MDETAQLRELLERLSVREALVLARAVELSRTQRQERLPTDLVLSGLRPTLQGARAARVPNLRRLVARAFEPFLTDGDDKPRIPGLIPRTSILPWWDALAQLVGNEIGALESRLAALVEAGANAAIDALAREAQAEAAAWTTMLVAELGRPQGNAVLRRLLPRPALVGDVTAMASFLALAEPLAAALAAIDEILFASGKLAGRRIIELTPDAVTVAKQHYLGLSETHGMDCRYLALALLNRLEQPWHILRLGRALSWKPNDSLLRDTEFGVVGERLIHLLEQSVGDIAALIRRHDELPDFATLGAAIAAYMDELEGLLGEFGFRRDNGWGEAILETRATLASSLSSHWLARVAGEAVLHRILPRQRRGARRGGNEPELGAPSKAAVLAALEAARLLIMLAQRGARHGLGQAREVVDALGAEIERRAATLLDLLRQVPGHAGIEAQITAAAAVMDILRDDGGGAVLIRRMRLVSDVTN